MLSRAETFALTLRQTKSTYKFNICKQKKKTEVTQFNHQTHRPNATPAMLREECYTKPKKRATTVDSRVGHGATSLPYPS